MRKLVFFISVLVIMALPSQAMALNIVSQDPFVQLSFDNAETMASYRGLTQLDQNHAVPDLADMWTKDGNVWTFHVRQNLKFSDGSILNAYTIKQSWLAVLRNSEDFVPFPLDQVKGAPAYVHSWNRTCSERDPDTGSCLQVSGPCQEFDKDTGECTLYAPFAPLPGSSVKILTPDAHTLKITLVSQTGWFALGLDASATAALPSPLRHDLDQNMSLWGLDYTNYPVSGPYKPSWSSAFVLNKNPYYWHASQVKINQFVYKSYGLNTGYFTHSKVFEHNPAFAPYEHYGFDHAFSEAQSTGDSDLTAAKYRSGAIDMVMSDIDLPDARKLTGYHEMPTTLSTYMGVNVNNVPDVRLRHAISLILDRKAIATSVEKIDGVPVFPSSTLAPGNIQGANVIRQSQEGQNILLAKSLLSQTHQTRPLRLYYPENRLAIKGGGSVAPLIVKQLQALGVQVELVKVDNFFEFLDALENDSDQVDLYMLDWYADYPDYWSYANLFDCDVLYNYSHYCNQNMHTLMNLERQTYADNSRNLKAYEIEKILTNQDYPVIGLYNPGRYVILNPKYTGNYYQAFDRIYLDRVRPV